MYNKVELCGVNTSQLPVLTEEENVFCSPVRMPGTGTPAAG